MKQYLFITLISLFAVLSCSEDRTAVRPFPRVRTHPVVDVTTQGAVFTGSVSFEGITVVDHGFNLYRANSYDDPVYLGSVSLGALVEEDFVYKWPTDMEAGKLYFVRAWVKSAKNTVLGEYQDFYSMGSAPPAIANVKPAIATWGDTVTIYGSNFSTVEGANSVTFGNVPVTMLDYYNDSIHCIVPNILASMVSDVTVKTYNQSSTIAAGFLLRPVEITDIWPSTGPVGMAVTISGNYFSLDETFVHFGSVSAQITGLEETNVLFIVPDQLALGPNNVQLRTRGQSSVNAGVFTVISPTITDVSPLIGTKQDTITITGTNFPYGRIGNVKIGGLTANILSATTTEIKLRTSAYLTPGTYDVVFIDGIREIVYPQQFTLIQ